MEKLSSTMQAALNVVHAVLYVRSQEKGLKPGNIRVERLVWNFATGNENKLLKGDQYGYRYNTYAKTAGNTAACS